jgi:hypothetical protein
VFDRVSQDAHFMSEVDLDKREKYYTVLFWVFCFVLFAKIGWYDLRAYLPLDERRQFITLSFVGWVIAQGLVWLPVSIQMLRSFNFVAALWCAFIAPYFILGILNGNTNAELIRDIVRYALPLGYLLFGLVIFRHVSLKNIFIAMLVTLSFWIVARTIIHLMITERTLRYGLQWEVFLPSLLIPLAYYARGWKLLAVLALFIAAMWIFMLGQTRASLLGVAASTSMCGLFAFYYLRKNFKSAIILGCVSLFAVIIALAPMFTGLGGKARLNAAAALNETTFIESNDGTAVQNNTAEDDIGETTQEPQTDKARLNAAAALDETTFIESNDGTAVQNNTAEKDMGETTQEPQTDAETALLQWEQAIARGGRSLDTRITEANYFLALTNESVVSMILGTGAGTKQSVSIPGGKERIVRAPHVTYAMVFYRHGYVVGTAMIVFLLLYGVRQHLRQLDGSREERLLAMGFLAYRASIAVIAFLHQGIIDDPIFFLSIAMAIALGEKANQTLKQNA